MLVPSLLKGCCITLILFPGIIFATNTAFAGGNAPNIKKQDLLNKEKKVCFIENKGQLSDKSNINVRYYFQDKGSNVYLTSNKLLFVFTKGDIKNNKLKSPLLDNKKTKSIIVVVSRDLLITDLSDDAVYFFKKPKNSIIHSPSVMSLLCCKKNAAPVLTVSQCSCDKMSKDWVEKYFLF